MAMIRYNIKCDKDIMKQKAMTCIFEGSAIEICAMTAYLIDRIYTAEIKKYGVKGLKSIHEMSKRTFDNVYDSIVNEYLKGGDLPDDNRDIQR